MTIAFSGASHLFRQPRFIVPPLHSFTFELLTPDLNKYFVTSRRKWALEKSRLLFLIYVYKPHTTFNQFSLKHFCTLPFPSFPWEELLHMALAASETYKGILKYLFRDCRRSHLLSHRWKDPWETLPMMVWTFWKASWPSESPGPLCISWLFENHVVFGTLPNKICF